MKKEDHTLLQMTIAISIFTAITKQYMYCWGMGVGCIIFWGFCKINSKSGE